MTTRLITGFETGLETRLISILLYITGMLQSSLIIFCNLLMQAATFFHFVFITILIFIESFFEFVFLLSLSMPNSIFFNQWFYFAIGFTIIWGSSFSFCLINTISLLFLYLIKVLFVYFLLIDMFAEGLWFSFYSHFVLS